MVDGGIVTAGAGRAVGTAAGKAVAGQFGKVRLGGREERRAVYGRFLESAVLYEAEMLAIVTKPVVLPHHWGRLQVVGAALSQALAQVQLSGNAEPVELAELLCKSLEHVSAQHRYGRWHNRGHLEIEVHYAVLARLMFIRGCRRDLLYLPKWWQVWRGAWWKARIDNWRTNRDNRKFLADYNKQRAEEAQERSN